MGRSEFDFLVPDHPIVMDAQLTPYSLALAEIRLVLTHMLWNFDMELAEETDDEWEKQNEWFIWNKKPLIVKLTPREV